jgi:hypothetical protein
VQYLYQETDQTESAICTKISFDVVAALRTVPAPLLAQLYQATIQLDSNQLVILIEQIAPDQPALAHLLTEKLDNFDLEYILNLLQGIL